jgi:hypothetical protein
MIGNQDTGVATQSAANRQVWSDQVTRTINGQPQFQGGDGNTQIADVASIPGQTLRYQLGNSFRSLFLRQHSKS